MALSDYPQMANAIRALSMDAIQAANSGHPGMPMGMADAATVLFDKFVKFDPAAPNWADRDRFVLSAGHGSMLLYSLLHLTGYKAMTMEQIKNFRQLGSITAGHPEYGHCPGADTTTGPLGQGIANAVGFALAERHMNAKFGDDLVDHRTWVICGDGCLMEGISQEAIALAGHLKLNKLTLLWDDNNITIDGSVDLADSTDQLKRFQACGWKTIAVDGHDMAAVNRALRAAQRSDKPTMIACKTVIGKGSPNKAGTSKIHGAPLGQEEIDLTKKALGIDYPAFFVPEDVAKNWKKPGRRGRKAHRAWKARLASVDNGAALTADLSGDLGDSYKAAMQEYREQLAKDMPKLATRASSNGALKVLTANIDIMVSGSADLEGSNKTRTPSTVPDIQAGDYGGRYINYGVREHVMGAVMNGLALHGGILPYAGTFLVFADYARPAMRLSALMNTRVCYVMTHDSIGVGEDGPTHQPVEHVASLRAIPGLDVYRPADAMEVAECWELAVERTDGPSVLALTRQGLPAVRDSADRNMSARGGYVLVPGEGSDQVVLVASGSEVHLAVEAQKQLADAGVSARVVSMPCLDLFQRQDAKYQRSVLGKDLPKIVIEAGVEQGWGRIIGSNGGFIGMDSFGTSGPGGELFEHFGITVDAIVEMAKDKA